MTPHAPVRMFSAIMLLLTCVTTPIGAQDARIAARLGLSHSTLGGNNSLDSYRSGIAAGLLLDMQVTGAWRVESGLVWIQKGASGTVQGFETGVPTRVRLTYVEVPLALRLEAGANSGIQPSVLAGAALAFKTACTQIHDVVTTATWVDCNDAPHARTDWSLVFGGGLKVPVGRAAVLLEGRYNHGMRNLFDTPRVLHMNRTFTLWSGFNVPGD